MKGVALEIPRRYCYVGASLSFRTFPVVEITLAGKSCVVLGSTGRYYLWASADDLVPSSVGNILIIPPEGDILVSSPVGDIPVPSPVGDVLVPSPGEEILVPSPGFQCIAM